MDGKRPIRSAKKKTRKPQKVQTSEDISEATAYDGLVEEDWNDSSTLNEESADYMSASIDLDFASSRIAERNRGKTAKKSKQHSGIKVISPQELTDLDLILHPGRTVFADRRRRQGQGLENNKTIDENISFHKNLFHYGANRPKISVKKAQKASTQAQNRLDPNMELDPPLLDSILRRLGIDPHITHATKARKALNTKIRAAINMDMVIIINEEKEMMQRMAGYWRFANRRTYNVMVRVNELWDWATGQKLPEIEEENEDGDLQSEVTLDGSTAVASSTRSPLIENYDDSDFDLPEGSIDLTASGNSEASSLLDRTDPAKTLTRASVSLGHHLHDADVERNETHSLTFSPGQLPGATLTFSVPSPASSDDEFTGELSDVEEEGEHLVAKKRIHPLFTLHETVSQGKAAEDFEGRKDTRELSVFLRAASPLKETVLTPASSWTSKVRKRSAINAVKKSSTGGHASRFDENNRFGRLKNEVAAPKEEPGLLRENGHEPKNITKQAHRQISLSSLYLPFLPEHNTSEEARHEHPKESDNTKTTMAPKSYKQNFPPLSSSATTTTNSSLSSFLSHLEITTSIPSTPSSNSITIATTTEKEKENTPTPHTPKSSMSNVISITPEVVHLSEAKRAPRKVFSTKKTAAKTKTQVKKAVLGLGRAATDDGGWIEVTTKGGR